MAIFSAYHAHWESFFRWLGTKSCCMPALHTVLAFPLGIIPTLLVGYCWIIEILLHKFTLNLFQKSAELGFRLTDLWVFLNIQSFILSFHIHKEVSGNFWIKTMLKNHVRRSSIQKWVCIMKFKRLWFLTVEFGFFHKVQWFFFLLCLFNFRLKFLAVSLSWISFTQSGITNLLNFNTFIAISTADFYLIVGNRRVIIIVTLDEYDLLSLLLSVDPRNNLIVAKGLSLHRQVAINSL